MPLPHNGRMTDPLRASDPRALPEGEHDTPAVRKARDARARMQMARAGQVSQQIGVTETSAER